MKGSTSHDDFKFKVSPAGNQAVGLVGPASPSLIPMSVGPCLQPQFSFVHRRNGDAKKDLLALGVGVGGRLT